ncbi:Endoribonuclease Dicer, partial [Stegodyphus mimosarum]
MKCFLNIEPSEMPKIFGLSASLLNRKCKPSQLEKNLHELEKTLRSTIITARDVSEIQKYGTDPEEIAIFYHGSEFADSDLKEEIVNLSNELKCKKSEFSRDEDALESDLLFEKQFRYSSEGVIFFDKPLRCLNAVCETFENLGLWCACTAAEIYLKEVTILCDRPIMEKYQKILEKVQKFLEDFIKKCEILLQKNENSMPHKLKRLLEIFFAVKESKKFINELPHISDVTFAEDPEEYFVNIKQIQEYSNSSDINVCSIVFVEQRITAYVLYQWLLYMTEKYPALAFLKPNFIVGHGRANFTETSMTEKKQKEIVSSFRKKECNILIATCVLEEGMDIRQCNLVIRFDLPKDFRSYVQSKGRA